MKFNVAICDDEKIAIYDIYRHLAKLRPNYKIDVYNNGEDLARANKDYDLIFLDIEMPGMDGLKLADNLRLAGKDSHIVFLTSHTEFMPEAFKVKAFRFLIKPIIDEDFFEAIIQFEKEILYNEIIILSKNGREIPIKVVDIICVEAFGDGCYIYIKDRIFESGKSLKYLEALLPKEHFFRVHKSYLVSLRHVKSMGRTEVEMNYMKNIVPVSRRKTSAFKTAFLEYIKTYAC